MNTEEVAVKQWTAQEILDTLTQRRDDLRGFGVCKIGLFGSHSRGEAGPESDIDFLVTLEGHSFSNYMQLTFFLESLFGRKVDVVPEKGLKPRVIPHVMKDVVYVEGL